MDVSTQIIACPFRCVSMSGATSVHTPFRVRRSGGGVGRLPRSLQQTLPTAVRLAARAVCSNRDPINRCRCPVAGSFARRMVPSLHTAVCFTPLSSPSRQDSDQSVIYTVTRLAHRPQALRGFRAQHARLRAMEDAGACSRTCLAWRRAAAAAHFD